MTSLSHAGEKDEVDVRPGLTYATHDGVALLGDLYRPKGAGPFPVLVALHGGGWVQGVRSAFQYWGPYLAGRGYALFAISYRLGERGPQDVSRGGARRPFGGAVRPRQRRRVQSRWRARRAHGCLGGRQHRGAGGARRRRPEER